MKVLAFLAALATSSIALAYPAVGDYVKYSGTLKLADGTQQPVVYEMELVEKNNGQFKNHQTLSVGGQIDSADEMVNEADLMNQVAVQYLVTNCKANGGTTSKATVPAGSFDVCMFGSADPESQSVYTIGDVPFGIVKVETLNADGSSSTLSLQEFRSGK